MIRSLFFIVSTFLPILFSAQGAAYTIYAVKFGERKRYVEMKDLAVGDRSGDTTKVFFMYWVLTGKDRVILVDAGFTEDAGIDTSVIVFTRPDKLLASIEIKPEDVTDIIITHPHWDHVGGIDLYPKAMVWMQEEDYKDLMAKRKDPETAGYNSKDIQKVRDRQNKGTLTLLKRLRDQVILPNVTVVITGSKHTPGSQYVMTNNGKQNVILASDNCKYYRNIEKMLSSPATTDQKAYIRNLRHMKIFAGDTDLVIPGHDPLVFSKFKSPVANMVEIKK